MSSYIGIDYGALTNTNRDLKTGVHYGVIPVNHLGQAWFDEAVPDCGDASCPQCGNEVTDAAGSREEEHIEDQYTDYGTRTWKDYVCHNCQLWLAADYVWPDEVKGYYVDDGEYVMQSDSEGDIFVMKSPYYTRADFCSPCAPGALYLPHPNKDGAKAYCPGHEWFGGEKAPYPIFRVSDDTEVI